MPSYGTIFSPVFPEHGQEEVDVAEGTSQASPLIEDRVAGNTEAESTAAEDAEELLIEEISIDGMCGVY